MCVFFISLLVSFFRWDIRLFAMEKTALRCARFSLNCNFSCLMLLFHFVRDLKIGSPHCRFSASHHALHTIYFVNGLELSLDATDRVITITHRSGPCESAHLISRALRSLVFISAWDADRSVWGELPLHSSLRQEVERLNPWSCSKKSERKL